MYDCDVLYLARSSPEDVEVVSKSLLQPLVFALPTYENISIGK